MAKPGVMFYFEIRPCIRRLTLEEKGRLFEAILDYGEFGTAPEVDGALGVAWDFIQPKIDRDSGRYVKQVEQKQYAVFAREMRKKGKEPIPFDEWNSLSDIERHRLVSDDNERYPNYKPQTTNNNYQTTNYNYQTTNIETEADKPREDFEKFWSAYPKKVGKKAAKKAFSRAEEPVETLLAAIERQKCSVQWSKDNGQYIPNPATWLNQGRWEDELGSPDPEQEYTPLASLEDPWEVAMREAGGYV